MFYVFYVSHNIRFSFLQINIFEPKDSNIVEANLPNMHTLVSTEWYHRTFLAYIVVRRHYRVYIDAIP